MELGKPIRTVVVEPAAERPGRDSGPGEGASREPGGSPAEEVGAEREECACGIHAAREPATVWSYLRGRDEPGTVARVLGRVLLWGRVVEHEGGWRASHASPLDFVATEPELARSLASLQACASC